MEPITLFILAAGILGSRHVVKGIVKIAYLTIVNVMNWFRTRRLHLDSNAVATTVLQRLGTGSYRTVQGVFNQATGNWLDHRVIDSNQIDADLRCRHSSRESAVYYI